MSEEKITPFRVKNYAHGGGRKDWCSVVVNKADGQAGTSADVMIYDEIGYWGITAADFVGQIDALDVATINLRLNSPGGDVYDAIAILNSLRNHDATVNVTVDGLAASAASFIAMAGDSVTMERNSEMMIHDAMGLVIGGPDDMTAFAERLNAISDNIASIYAERAGGTAEDWRVAMNAETWYSAQEAVDAGLADKVTEPKNPPKDSPSTKNRFDLSVFNYAGRENAPGPTSRTPVAAPAGGKQVTPKEGSDIVAFSDESITTLRHKLGVVDDADEGTILAALEEALQERATPPVVTRTELPEGVVAIDSAQLDELRQAAQLGREAHERQEQTSRDAIVDAAISDGRIAPVRRTAWLNRLKADPAEAATLAGLEKGLVPFNEIGRSDGQDNDTTNQPINDAEAQILANMTGAPKEAFLRG